MKKLLLALLFSTAALAGTNPPLDWGADNKAALGQQGLSFPQASSSIGTPPAGRNYFYVKPDGIFYTKDSSGIETAIGSGGGGGGSSRMDRRLSDPAPGTIGYFFLNTAEGAPKYDTGSQITTFTSRAVQGSWGSPVVLTASSGITPVNDRFQSVYVAGAGAVDVSGHDPQISPGFKDQDEMSIYGTNDTNTVRFATGNGLKMNYATTFRAHTVCTYLWNQGASVWTQKGWCNDL